jgi:hypothetical protein
VFHQTGGTPGTKNGRWSSRNTFSTLEQVEHFFAGGAVFPLWSTWSSSRFVIKAGFDIRIDHPGSRPGIALAPATSAFWLMARKRLFIESYLFSKHQPTANISQKIPR